METAKPKPDDGKPTGNTSVPKRKMDDKLFSLIKKSGRERKGLFGFSPDEFDLLINNQFWDDFLLKKLRKKSFELEAHRFGEKGGFLLDKDVLRDLLNFLSGEEVKLADGTILDTESERLRKQAVKILGSSSRKALRKAIPLTDSKAVALSNYEIELPDIPISILRPLTEEEIERKTMVSTISEELLGIIEKLEGVPDGKNRIPLEALNKEEFKKFMDDPFWYEHSAITIFGIHGKKIETRGFLQENFFLDGLSDGNPNVPSIQGSLVKIFNGEPIVLNDGTEISESDDFRELRTKAKYVLLSNNVPSILKQARAYARRYQVDIEPLLSGGAMGLLYGISKFDGGKGNSLRKYVHHFIGSGIKAALEKEKGELMNSEVSATNSAINSVRNHWMVQSPADLPLGKHSKILRERMAEEVRKEVEKSNKVKGRPKIDLEKTLEALEKTLPDTVNTHRCSDAKILFLLFFNPSVLPDAAMPEISKRYRIFVGPYIWRSVGKKFSGVDGIQFRNLMSEIVNDPKYSRTFELRFTELLEKITPKMFLPEEGEGYRDDEQIRLNAIYASELSDVLDREVGIMRIEGLPVKTPKADNSRMGLSILEKIVAMAFRDSYVTIGVFREFLKEYAKENPRGCDVIKNFHAYLERFKFKDRDEEGWHYNHDNETLDAMNDEMLAGIIGCSVQHIGKHHKAFVTRFNDFFKDKGEFKYVESEVPVRSKAAEAEEKLEYTSERWIKLTPEEIQKHMNENPFC